MRLDVGWQLCPQAALRVRGLSTAFKAKDRTGQGFADFSYDDFMKMVLRL
jgi:hypothetical protein